MDGFGSDIQLLSQLLNPKRGDESDNEEELENIRTGNTYLSPADINANAKPAKLNKDQENVDEEKIKLKEELAEFFDEDGNTKSQSVNDWKQKPTWDISYRQQITASDVFLQMGAKNPSTASCENMIVKVHLPGELHPNIDVKVLKEHLEINSPKFYLNVPLPHPVDPQLGNAQFENETGCLTLTLFMRRELDYVNF